MLRLFSILVCLFFAFPVWAQETLIIDEVLDGQTVHLSDDQIIMLGGIYIPDMDKAKEFLVTRFKGKSIQPLPEEMIENRYGEAVAHLKTLDGVWIQEELVKSGVAFAYTMSSFRDKQKELLAAESNVKALDGNNPIDKTLKDFQIVEGSLVDAVERGRYVYLNFGEDWKTDFTISTQITDHKKFLEEGFDILELKGKKIQIRGWMDHYNGPFIHLTYPEQIQIVQ